MDFSKGEEEEEEGVMKKTIGEKYFGE